MELKQDSSHRIIFLQKFTQELLINSRLEHRKQERIEAEKVKQQLTGKISPEDAFKSIIRNPGSPLVKPIEKDQPSEYQQSMMNQKQFIIEPNPRTHLINQIRPMQQRFHSSMKPQKISPYENPQQTKTLSEIKPEPELKPEGFHLQKIDPFIKDQSIQSIECPGPGKNILVKRFNQINATKVNLNQAEIMDIINEFAKDARIPVVGGILKAAVGNLIISAVNSDFVGSRFIINKISNY